jgi:hypothetical protein
VDYPYDLGPYSRKVTTSSTDAQRWFDRGLNCCFGFHHEEAIACFEKALEADPNCAMAHWASRTRPGRTTTIPGNCRIPPVRPRRSPAVMTPLVPRSRWPAALPRPNAR